MSKLLVPLKDYVVVKRLPPAKSPGGLILPDSAQEKSMIAEVVCDSPCKGDHEYGLRPGVFVLLQKYAGHEVKLDDQQYIIVKMSEILAVVDEVEEESEPKAVVPKEYLV